MEWGVILGVMRRLRFGVPIIVLVVLASGLAVLASKRTSSEPQIRTSPPAPAPSTWTTLAAISYRPYSLQVPSAWQLQAKALSWEGESLTGSKASPVTGNLYGISYTASDNPLSDIRAAFQGQHLSASAGGLGTWDATLVAESTLEVDGNPAVEIDLIGKTQLGSDSSMNVVAVFVQPAPHAIAYIRLAGSASQLAVFRQVAESIHFSPSVSEPWIGQSGSLTALKLDVLSAIGDRIDYCDPDTSPVAFGDPIDWARRRMPTIRADIETYSAILAHEHISPNDQLSKDQLIAIDEDYKQIQAISMREDSGVYRFSALVANPEEAIRVDPYTPEQTVSGTVTNAGVVRLSLPSPGERLNCPICLAEGMHIATPSGPIAVQRVRVGLTVWTTTSAGQRVKGVVTDIGHSVAPLGHEVVRLVLADGRTVDVSPGHPTSDGRTVGALRPGDPLDGSTVVSSALRPYSGEFTYDILVSGETGTYFANGIHLGSTLAQGAPLEDAQP